MSAPEGSETVSLPMAGFPGRWLETLCFLISFTPSTSQPWTRSGGGWGGGAVLPQAPGRRAEASDYGRGEARLAWPLEICGRAAAR